MSHCMTKIKHPELTDDHRRANYLQEIDGVVGAPDNNRCMMEDKNINFINHEAIASLSSQSYHLLP